jgi:hypothetical protein
MLKENPSYFKAVEIERDVQKQMDMAAGKASKADKGKQRWFSTPLVVLEPLADAFKAGEQKYAAFNCLNPFDDPNSRFYDGTLRHLRACQLDPLAIDQEIKEKYGIEVYHAAQVAFNSLLRLHHCRMEQGDEQKDLSLFEAVYAKTATASTGQYEPRTTPREKRWPLAWAFLAGALLWIGAFEIIGVIRKIWWP